MSSAIPAPVDPDTPSADIRIGYARCSSLTQELQSQLDALAGHGIPRDRIFAEKISTRVRVRPQFEAALAAAREIKAHAPHCRLILTVNEMKRLGRDAAELTARRRHSPSPPLPHPAPGRSAHAGRSRPPPASPGPGPPALGDRVASKIIPWRVSGVSGNRRLSHPMRTGGILRRVGQVGFEAADQQVDGP
ncbi:recombinase family protein, partial [Streptomyces sp. NPDC003032]